jgi:hypothetical protein
MVMMHFARKGQLPGGLTVTRQSASSGATLNWTDRNWSSSHIAVRAWLETVRTVKLERPFAIAM